MWVLSHIKTGRRFYLLTNTKKYTVGRNQQCDLSLTDDTSVSRDHAVIHRSSSGVRVEDRKSKYGVYVNNGIDSNRGITPGETVELHAGNIVRFGRLGNTFRLENIPVNICTSTLGSADIEQLQKQLKVIDGTLMPNWSTECTHLVMTNITVTIKVLQSLAYGVPIVSPDYFAKYIESAEAHSAELPNVKEFVPDITEPYIVKEPGMMEVHLDRQRLFQNKTFVFMVKRHMLRFEPIIKLAAGKTLNLETDKLKKSILLKSDYISVNHQSSASSQCAVDVDNLMQYMESNNRRLINDSEIGLAIIHRAIDRFCNPDRRMVTDFQPEEVNTNEIIGHVLVQETPIATNTEKDAHSSLIIPETVELTGSEPNNNLHGGGAIDLDEPSTSSTRRSTRSSVKASNVSTNMSAKTPTPKKGAPKRRLNEENDQQEQGGGKEVTEGEKSMPEKRQKIDGVAESQGESSSVHSVEPMPPQSQSDHNFSGFISTQSRSRTRKATQEQAAATQLTPVASESSKVNRKRAVDLLNADSDDEQNECNDHNFNFSRKPKRTKVNSREARHPERNTLIDNNDVGGDGDGDGGDLFGFSKKTLRSQKQKSTQQKLTQKTQDEVDAPLITESQNSYRRPFQQNQNRMLNHSIMPVEISTVAPCDAEWISLKIKKELNLNDTRSEAQPSGSVKIKDEHLDEWDMTKEEKKRQWIKSMANVFTVRTVEVNQTRRSMIDEADSRLFDSGDTSHNKSKNFKKFVKKNNFIPRTVVIKTTPVPVTISHFARI